MSKVIQKMRWSSAGARALKREAGWFTSFRAGRRNRAAISRNLRRLLTGWLARWG